MNKIITFFRRLILKSSVALAAERTLILKVFTTAAEDLKALNDKIDSEIFKHSNKIIKAQTKIDASIGEQKSLVDVKTQNENVAKKIEALLS